MSLVAAAGRLSLVSACQSGTRQVIVFADGDSPDGARFTVIRDGFGDDSVRGDAHRIELRRQADGSWQPVAAEVFRRCWRGDVVERFIAGNCPQQSGGRCWRPALHRAAGRQRAPTRPPDRHVNAEAPSCRGIAHVIIGSAYPKQGGDAGGFVRPSFGRSSRQ